MSSESSLITNLVVVFVMHLIIFIIIVLDRMVTSSQILYAKKIPTNKYFFRTEFYTRNGALFHVITPTEKQPSIGKADFEIDGIKYTIIWGDPPGEKKTSS